GARGVRRRSRRAPARRDGLRPLARAHARLPHGPVLVRAVRRAPGAPPHRGRRRHTAETAAAERRLTDRAAGALPDRNLRDLLPGRASALVAAHAARRALAPVHHRRALLRLQPLRPVAVRGNVPRLGYFKYYDFFATSTNNMFAWAGIDVPFEARSIILPV